jgi:hypothetical protein
MSQLKEFIPGVTLDEKFYISIGVILTVTELWVRENGV